MTWQGTIVSRGALIGLFLPALLLVQPGLVEATGGPDGAEVVAGLQLWLDETRDLEGDFEQILSSGALGSGLRETGKLWIHRPGKMRWDYREPENKVAIVDGEKTLLWVEEDRQMIRGRLDGEGDLLSNLLAGEGRIADLFTVTPEIESVEGDRGSFRVRLVPKRESEALEEIVLEVLSPQFSIVAAEVLDATGNRIEYRFSRLRRNRGVPARRFEFEPPPGTEILGEHQ
jgi:outer membrane lipoprotein carrier protein